MTNAFQHPGAFPGVFHYPGEEFRGDPVRLPDAPVARVRLPGGDDVWLVQGYEEVRAALQHPLLARQVDHEGPKAGDAGIATPRDHRTLQADGPDQAGLRRLATRAFTPQRVELMRSRIQRTTNDLLDAMEKAGPPADLVAHLGDALPARVVCDLLGVAAEDRPRFGAWADTVVTLTGVSRQRMETAHQELQAYLAERVEEKRRRPGDDLISGWLSAQEADDRLTDAEVGHLAMMVLVAGTETTANAIGAGVWRLFLNPAQLAALRADRTLLAGAVEEILRYQPQSPMFLVMSAREDFDLSGVRISKGEGVMPLPFAANRDPSRFPDPDRFDITRKGPAHITFGHGPHVCIGASLARLELTTALGALLDRFPSLRPATDPHALSWRNDKLANGLRELPVEW
ncbi:cytochrome P450 [Streptomyces sp. NPDC001941]|uniref:cytochrome P450 n=1 Tax=Streptomyces sp. NPDC001941 TaxID=3154659 RepID=UPI0033258995